MCSTTEDASRRSMKLRGYRCNELLQRLAYFVRVRETPCSSSTLRSNVQYPSFALQAVHARFITSRLLRLFEWVSDRKSQSTIFSQILSVWVSWVHATKQDSHPNGFDGQWQLRWVEQVTLSCAYSVTAIITEVTVISPRIFSEGNSSCPAEEIQNSVSVLL